MGGCKTQSCSHGASSKKEKKNRKSKLKDRKNIKSTIQIEERISVVNK